MFNYPEVAERLVLEKLIKAEQRCCKPNCGKWFEVPVDRVVAHEQELRERGMAIWADITCPHCGEGAGIILIGKYDRPRSKFRDKCSLQFYTWRK